MKEMNTEYQRAQAHVNEVREFYQNVVSYLGVMVMLTVINLFFTPGYFWVKWPMLGWGIGVLFHGLNVFIINSRAGRNWEEKKIRQFMGEDDYQSYRKEND